MGNTIFGQPISDLIAQAIAGNNTCQAIPTLGKLLGADVHYSNYQGLPVLEVVDNLGQSFIISMPPAGSIIRNDGYCGNQNPQAYVFSQLAQQQLVQQQQGAVYDQGINSLVQAHNQVHNGGTHGNPMLGPSMSPNVAMGVGAMRKWKSA
jgi:hypothetical protein